LDAFQTGNLKTCDPVGKHKQDKKSLKKSKVSILNVIPLLTGAVQG
jgi:hypothetical protein